jgi:hypothetical protein
VQAGDVTLKSVFSDNHRYEIPMFQRPYVWAADREWSPMWDDIRAAANGVVQDTTDDSWPDEPPRYFLGSIVVKTIQRNPQRIDGSLLIDGQQRLTTLQILLAAARAVAAVAGAETAAGRFAAWLENDAATVHDNFPDDRHKLWPLPQDRDEFLWAIRPPGDLSNCPDPLHQVCRARVWFEEVIADWAGDGVDADDRLTALHSALNDRMQVAMITLEKTDNAQVIFEALNHRGVELSQSDLIKNLLFRLVEDQGQRKEAESLLVNHWLPLDSRRWRLDVTSGRITRNRLDVVLAYWLTIQKQSAVSVEHLFDEFKTWVLDGSHNAADVIKAVREHADLYDRLIDDPPSHEAAVLIDHVVATKTNTVWPLLLSLFSQDQAVPKSEQSVAVSAIGSYLMRRGVCGLTTKDYNNIFVSTLKASAAAEAAETGATIRDTLSGLRAESRWWPSDSEFVGALIGSNFYALSKPRIRAFFVGIENRLRDEQAEDESRIEADNGALNIEHVLPQAWRTHWPLAPSDDPQKALEVRERAVNALGNLTLTNGRLNSKMRNSDWATKRTALGAKSTLLITTSSILASPGASVLRDWDGEWDESAIDARTIWLVSLAISTWPRPEVEDESLDDQSDDDDEPSQDADDLPEDDA